MSKLREKLTYSNVIASVALFAALSGVAVAAGLPRNSVGPNQLKKGAVTGPKIRKGAVTAGKLGPKSVVAGKLGPNAVTPGNIVNGGITTAKIGGSAVIASSIKNGVITTNKLANANVTTAKLADANVTTAKLANDSVTAAKLGPEVLGTPTPLRTGQTMRGVFDLGGTAGGVNALFRAAVSYQFPLSGNPPVVTIVKKGAPPTAICPGLGTSGSSPGAAAGNLCIYLTEEKNLTAAEGLSPENNTRLGFGLVAKAEAATDTVAYGQWAVTAP